MSAPATGPVVVLQLVATPPLTVQLKVPVGAGLGVTPVTVAVKVMALPTVVVVTGAETTLIVGVTLARLIGKVAEEAVR